MRFLPIDRLHGDRLVNRKAVATLASGVPLAPASTIVAATAAPIEAITYRMWLGRPVAEVTTAKGTRLFDARTGAALPTPTAAEAEAVSRAAWRGSGRTDPTVERTGRPRPEYRGTLPAPPPAAGVAATAPTEKGPAPTTTREPPAHHPPRPRQKRPSRGPSRAAN